MSLISAFQIFGIYTDEVSLQIIRAITGRVFSKDQINLITKHSVGRLFSDLFPLDSDDTKAIERVKEAEVHISRASDIVASLQRDLHERSKTLGDLLLEIESKQKMVEHYSVLAEAGKNQISALKIEIESAIRKELLEQANKGRRIRQIASLSIWLFTLIAGAALGAYFLDVVRYIRSYLGV